MNEFRAGVTAVLRTWSAFRTAVESHWGGDDSLRKAEDLRNNILEHFDGSSVPPKSMSDVTDLEDALAIYMEEEFSLQLEDRSEQETARLIWEMYDKCSKGDFQLALQMVESAETVVAKVKSYPVKVQAPEHDDDEEDDDDDMEEEQDDAQQGKSDPSEPSMEDADDSLQRSTVDIIAYGALPLFGVVPTKPSKPTPPPRQLGEQAPVEPTTAPPTDEDGFAPVPRKRKPARK